MLNVKVPALAACALSAAGVQAQFTVLPASPGAASSVGYSVSPGGRYAGGGIAGLTPGPAFIWSESGGMIGLGQPPGSLSTRAEAATDAGSVVAGVAIGGDSRGFRWTPGNGMQLLDLPVGMLRSGASDISASGAAIAGWVSTSSPMTQRPVIWPGGTLTPFMLPMPAGAPASVQAFADDVSPDGLIVVGTYRTLSELSILRWVSGGPPQTLVAGLPEGLDVLDISQDQSTVVGYILTSGPPAPTYVPQRLVLGGPLHTLPLLPGMLWGIAHAASADGSTVVGQGGPDYPWFIGGDMRAVNRAFIWTATGGTQLLSTYLAAQGLSTSGWTLVSANAISDNGRTIVGTAMDGTGAIRAFVASWSELCYPDCNVDGSLTVGDFGCFQTKFVAADPYADCNADGSFTVADFGCFQTEFVAGCP